MSFAARHAGRCRLCGIAYRKGTQITTLSGYDKPAYGHALCGKQLRDQRKLMEKTS